MCNLALDVASNLAKAGCGPYPEQSVVQVVSLHFTHAQCFQEWPR